MFNQITQVIRSGESYAARKQYIAEKRRSDGEGFLCLLDCDDLVGFHVFDDEELGHILNAKCKQVCFENLKDDYVICSPF